MSDNSWDNNLLSFHLLPENINFKIQETMIFPDVLYGSEITLTLMRGFIICTACQILLECSNQGGLYEQGFSIWESCMQHFGMKTQR
jgi:hypothetical protein